MVIFLEIIGVTTLLGSLAYLFSTPFSSKGKRIANIKKSGVLFLVSFIAALLLPPVEEDFSSQEKESTQSSLSLSRSQEAPEVSSSNSGEETRDDNIRSSHENRECSTRNECLFEEHRIDAYASCQIALEEIAEYDFKWKEKWYEYKFDQYTFETKIKSSFAVLGDKIAYQNGFGAFQNHRYACIYDYENEEVLRLLVEPGRY